jgi:muramidase (phage lysozyme)
MAYTVSQDKTVFGNKRVHICTVTADAASGTIPTGLSAIDGYSLSPVSMATGAPLIKASGGTITVSNAVNGDNFYLVVYGR